MADMQWPGFAPAMDAPKASVREFWDEGPCGARLYLDGDSAADYDRQASIRYALEPAIEDFARFREAAGKDVLEIGVGLGADHQRFAEAGARLTGVDLTPAAIAHTRRRLSQRNLSSALHVADAETLPFASASFDFVYSWGVIHHTPDMAAAAREILRVLRPGGRYAIMVYNRWSIVGMALWLRYGAVRGHDLSRVYADHLESPGTKAVTPRQAMRLFPGAKVRVTMSPGDLLEGGAGQRHRGPLLSAARKIWPRPLLRRLPRLGLFLMIEGIA